MRLIIVLQNSIMQNRSLVRSEQTNYVFYLTFNPVYLDKAVRFLARTNEYQVQTHKTQFKFAFRKIASPTFNSPITEMVPRDQTVFEKRYFFNGLTEKSETISVLFPRYGLSNALVAASLRPF